MITVLRVLTHPREEDTYSNSTLESIRPGRQIVTFHFVSTVSFRILFNWSLFHVEWCLYRMFSYNCCNNIEALWRKDYQHCHSDNFIIIITNNRGRWSQHRSLVLQEGRSVESPQQRTESFVKVTISRNLVMRTEEVKCYMQPNQNFNF